MTAITDLTTQFFHDCEKDGREANQENLRAWLWFTCPATLRVEVESAIRSHERWNGKRRKTSVLQIRLTADERALLESRANDDGVSMAEYIRRHVLVTYTETCLPTRITTRSEMHENGVMRINVPCLPDGRPVPAGAIVLQVQYCPSNPRDAEFGGGHRLRYVDRWDHQQRIWVRDTGVEYPEIPSGVFIVACE